MRYIKGKTFAELYHSALREVYENPDFECSPRGQKVKECLNGVLELEDITSNLFKCDGKALTMPTGYTKKEISLYLSATSSAELFGKASSFWSTIKNKDGTVNSAYGNLIFNKSLADGRSQFEWAFDSLKADKDSRQAFMRFNNTTHQFNGNKDLPCTFIQIFHIRNNKLYSTVEMRSNDLTTGTVHDIPSFTLFQYLMYLRLREECYPELECGSYTHIASSLHLYEKDFELAKKRIDAGLVENRFPLPRDWRCIKSADANDLVDIKVCKQDHLFHDWTCKDNEDFYGWILS